MKNPFEKQEIILHLNLTEMNILQRIVGSAVPDGKDKETVIIYVYNVLTEEINKMNEP